MAHTNKKPARLIVNASGHDRLLARIWQNNKGDTTTVKLGGVVNHRFGDDVVSVRDEHFSVHRLDRREGALIKLSTIFDGSRKEDACALVFGASHRFCYPIVMRRYGLVDLPLDNNADGALFRVPDYDDQYFHIFVGYYASSRDLRLPDVPGWLKREIVTDPFRVTAYVNWSIGMSHQSTTSFFHATSAPRVNGVPAFEHDVAPGERVRLGAVQRMLQNDRDALIERHVSKIYKPVGNDAPKAPKVIRNAILTSQNAMIIDPAEVLDKLRAGGLDA